MIDLERFMLNDDESGHYVWVKDPVDGGQVLRNETRNIMFDWCYENCQGKYWIGMGFGRFELDQDAVLFRLTWA